MATVGLVGCAGVVVFGLLFVIFFFKGISLKLPVIGIAVFALVAAAGILIPRLDISLPALPFIGNEPSPTVQPEEESQPPESGGFPQVLLDKRGLVITATRLVENGIQGSALIVSIENRSETDVTIEVRDVCVNGWMMDTSFFAAVAAGQETEGAIVFLAAGMKRSGVETIADMEFSFYILDQNRVLFLNSGPVTVRISAADTGRSPFDGQGEELYHENGVRIVSMGFAEQESVFGPELVLLIENTTDRTVTVQARNVSVNGSAADVVFSEDILAGRRAAAAVTITGLSREELREISFCLRVLDRDRRTTLFDTGSFTVRADQY